MPAFTLTVNDLGTLIQSEEKQPLQLTKDPLSPGQLFVTSVGG